MSKFLKRNDSFMSKNGIPGYFPVLINLEKFPCLVVGGGDVALRKVLSLLEFNASVTVIAPKLCTPLIELSRKKKIKIIRKPYSIEYLNDYKITFCATDNEKINLTVFRDCREKNILINTADNLALCDFILPANIKRGDLTISIASQGKAPFFTRAIKKKIEVLIPPVYSDITKLAGDFRKKVLTVSRKKSSHYKPDMFKKFSSTDWEEIMRGNGKRKSKYQIQKLLKEPNKS